MDWLAIVLFVAFATALLALCIIGSCCVLTSRDEQHKKDRAADRARLAEAWKEINDLKDQSLVDGEKIERLGSSCSFNATELVQVNKVAGKAIARIDEEIAALRRAEVDAASRHLNATHVFTRSHREMRADHAALSERVRLLEIRDEDTDVITDEEAAKLGAELKSLDSGCISVVPDLEPDLPQHWSGEAVANFNAIDKRWIDEHREELKALMGEAEVIAEMDDVLETGCAEIVFIDDQEEA